MSPLPLLWTTVSSSGCLALWDSICHCSWLWWLLRPLHVYSLDSSKALIGFRLGSFHVFVFSDTCAGGGLLPSASHWEAQLAWGAHPLVQHVSPPRHHFICLLHQQNLSPPK